MTLADYIKAAEKKAEHIGMEKGLEQGQKLGLEQGQKLGLEQGLEQGQAQLLDLIQRMSANGEADQILRLSTDPAFLKESFQKYGFSGSLGE